MRSLVLAVRKRKGEPGRLKFSRQHFLTQRLALFNNWAAEGVVKVEVICRLDLGKQEKRGDLYTQANNN